MIKASDKKLIIDFEELVDVIKSSTSINPFREPVTAKRINNLLNDYEAFCTYYFPEYCFAPFAWFLTNNIPPMLPTTQQYLFVAVEPANSPRHTAVYSFHYT